MSSINKSGKRFQPKIKQRARRVPGLMTPQSSQTLTRASQLQSQEEPPQPTQTSQLKTQVETHTEDNITLFTPVSPVSQHVRVDISAEPNEKEKEPEVEHEPTESMSTFATSSEETSTTTRESEQANSNKVETINTIIQPSIIKPPERKTSVSGSGHLFTQPTINNTHRTRLNSLSIPTQLSTGFPPSSRRGSVVSNANSRRGSVILPSTNPITSGPSGGLGSRRGSFITPGSRRGSVTASALPIIDVGDKKRRGSVSNSLDHVTNEKPVAIPILKTNKKRRISINFGPSKRKDVSVGGISIKGSVASKKKELGQSDGNHEDKENVADNGKENGKNSRKRSSISDDVAELVGNGASHNNMVTEKEKEKEKEEEKGKENNKEKEAEVTKEPVKLEVNEFERGINQKWVMNTQTNRFQLVEVDAFEQDVIKQQEFALSHDIEDVSELHMIQKKSIPELGDDLVFNEKKMKLSDLCKPFLPVGKRSKNYYKAVEGQLKIEEAARKRRLLREQSKKLRMSIEAVQKMNEDGSGISAEMDEKERNAKVKELMERDRSEDGNKKHNVPVLQMQDGKVTYSHESTVVDRHEETNTEMERVEENPFENIVTSQTYSKRKTTMKWTPHEVAELLKAISLWGTDFGLIAKLFPYRTRRQVKSKFLTLERVHPHLIEFALLRKLPVDIEEYSGKSGMEFKSLEEYNREMAELKVKHEEELKAMEIAREQAQAEDREAQQQLHGSGSQGIPNRRSRKAVIAEFRKNEEVVGSIDS